MEMNTTNFDPSHYAELRKVLNTMTLIIYSLAFVLGVLGNGVVIWVTGFKLKKTVNTVWLLNLAIADFLFTSFLPLNVTYIALNFHWPFGKFMCKLNSALRKMSVYASVYNLMVIGVDRCVSVVLPVWAQNHRNVRKAFHVCLGIWILALILSIPDFVFRDTGPSFLSENITVCFTNYILSDDYDLITMFELEQLRFRATAITWFILGFVVPYTVIVSCYAVIIYRVRRSPTLASKSSRIFKTIAAVIIIFFLCWAPYHIMALIEMANFTAMNPSETLDHAITIGIPLTTSLAFLSSCFNPLLYVFMGQDFRDKVRKTILKALETAFQEDTSSALTDSKSMDTIESKAKSVN